MWNRFNCLKHFWFIIHIMRYAKRFGANIFVFWLYDEESILLVKIIRPQAMPFQHFFGNIGKFAPRNEKKGHTTSHDLLQSLSCTRNKRHRKSVRSARIRSEE